MGDESTTVVGVVSFESTAGGTTGEGILAVQSSVLLSSETSVGQS